MAAASLLYQGIDPAHYGNAQWFGDAPSTDDFLIHLTKKIIQMMNERAHDHPIWALLKIPDSPNPKVKASKPTKHSSSRSQIPDTLANGPIDFLASYKALARDNPNFRTEIFNSSATFDDKTGRGAVIVNVHLNGLPCGNTKDGVILASWRREREEEGLRRGKWRCVNLIMVFGCPVAPQWRSAKTVDGVEERFEVY